MGRLNDGRKRRELAYQAQEDDHSIHSFEKVAII
jgi:hypothetical protein